MADVGRRPSLGSAGNNDGGDRGQLIIVTALAMAIIFVTLALILNTAIYTENLATRSGDIGGGTDAVRYHDAARVGVGGTIDYVNAHNNSSHRTLQANLSTGVDDFRNHSARLFASGDRSVETNLAGTENGTRIAQSDVNRNFSNKSGAANWTVVSGVEHTRAFRMNVTRTSLDSPSDQPFTIIVDDGSNPWRLNVSTDGSDVIVTTTETSCRAGGDSAWINISDETLGGTSCEDLSFVDAVSGTYSIRFENGSNASGTYSFVVNQSTLAGSPGPDLFDDGSGQPFAAHAVYSANVTVTYETPRLFYNTTVRVAPGESDG